MKRDRGQFARTGLVIEYLDAAVHSVKIGEEIRWAQVSVIQKIIEGLPTTINALESINGHLNHIVGRNNPFWASICRLAEQI
jgi:hypothetical protein